MFRYTRSAYIHMYVYPAPFPLPKRKPDEITLCGEVHMGEDAREIVKTLGTLCPPWLGLLYVCC